mgnify:CR=1 FL=1
MSVACQINGNEIVSFQVPIFFFFLKEKKKRKQRSPIITIKKNTTSMRMGVAAQITKQWSFLVVIYLLGKLVTHKVSSDSAILDGLKTLT